MLGIAYILSIIPIVNIIGLILQIIGWIKLGNNYKENLWKYVGYSAILGLIAMLLFVPTILGAMATGDVGAMMTSIFTVGAAAIVLFLIYAILQLIGLWKAGSKFNSNLLKAGAILSIIPVLNFIGYILAGAGFLSAKTK